MAMKAPRHPPINAAVLTAAPGNWAALPLPVPADEEDVALAEAVAAVVVKDIAEVVAVAPLATTATAGDVECVELEELVVETSAVVADAAQAHTALAEACTARPVTAPQPFRTPVSAAVLIATVESHE